jgi:Cu(I)/Ag(I) efflux system protein CusF
MKLSAAVLMVAAFTFGGLSHAQQGAVHQASGKVTKIDPAAGRVTIAHGPVASLKWPPMTMAFEVKDKALFDKLQQGANIEFSFVQSDRKHVVTAVK